MINCSDTNRPLGNYLRSLDESETCPDCGNELLLDLRNGDGYCPYCERMKKESFEENFE